MDEKCGLYIHIPFCEKKCNYCDFCSIVADSEQIDAYIVAVIEESRRLASDRVFDTVFIGGGTPTAMPCGALARLFNGVAKNLNIVAQEFTIEGNPNSYTQAKIDEFLAIGMTRASLGVQTFNDEILSKIGRLHSGQQARDAIVRLINSGVDVSCDIMIGLPNQTVNIVSRDVNTAVQLGVGHLSCYALILEDGTPMHSLVARGKMILPDEDNTVDMYDEVYLTLQKSGLLRYEISNFGKPCLHNLGYWQRKDYLGLGVSAHSLIDGIRYSNATDVSLYIAGNTREVVEKLDERDKAIEIIILGLRTSSGFDLDRVKAHLNPEQYLALLEILKKDNKYYHRNASKVVMREEYYYIHNSLLNKFLDI